MAVFTVTWSRPVWASPVRTQRSRMTVSSATPGFPRTGRRPSWRTARRAGCRRRPPPPSWMPATATSCTSTEGWTRGRRRVVPSIDRQHRSPARLRRASSPVGDGGRHGAVDGAGAGAGVIGGAGDEPAGPGPGEVVPIPTGQPAASRSVTSDHGPGWGAAPGPTRRGRRRRRPRGCADRPRRGRPDGVAGAELRAEHGGAGGGGDDAPFRPCRRRPSRWRGDDGDASGQRGREPGPESAAAYGTPIRWSAASSSVSAMSRRKPASASATTRVLSPSLSRRPSSLPWSSAKNGLTSPIAE